VNSAPLFDRALEGAGGIVFDKRGEMLCMRERFGNAPSTEISSADVA
jgi:hypothetical protein